MRNRCKRPSVDRIRREILAVLRHYQDHWLPLYASEVAQKIFERTRSDECPVSISDAIARRELRNLAESGEVVEHTELVYIPAARSRRPLSRYSIN